MKRLLLRTIVLLLRIVYAPIRRRPVQRRVAILSRQSDEPSVDIRLLTDYMKLRYPDVECVVLAKFIQGGLAGKLAYLPHMLRQMNCIATSKVVVLDGYCIPACVLRHKPETKIIQMWHAIAAIKKFGYQTIGRPGGHSADVAEIMCMHRGYDHILCPGGRTTELFCEAFHAEPAQMLPIGLPRLDLLWDSDDSRAKIREAYGIPEKKEILLYVPTFRKNRPVYLKELIRSVNPEKFVLVIRLHPLEEDPAMETMEIPEKLQIIFDRTRSTEEWIRACDRIVTDYSALGVEASLTDKPIYYYVYDISAYEQTTGLNVDPRVEMPAATAITGLQLADLLTRDYDYEALARFRDRYITIDTDACTARLGDFIYGIIEEIHPEVPDAPSETAGSGA